MSMGTREAGTDSDIGSTSSVIFMVPTGRHSKAWHIRSFSIHFNRLFVVVFFTSAEADD